MKTPEPPTPIRLLRLPEVIRRTGLSRTHLWRLAQRGDFPSPTHLGRSAFWSSEAIDEWVRRVLAGRDGGEASK